MCWLFHKWSKWSDPIPARVTYLWGGSAHVRAQTRTCEKCGKYEERIA